LRFSALNRRLHDTLTTAGPTAKAARDQDIRVGDIIMSRSNDATITVAPSPHHSTDTVDQVRNGNRWRVAAIDPGTNRLAAERLTDMARAVFDADYLTEHVTLGYAATAHSAQGVTADSSYAILGEGASRAMAYVAMTRGRHNNEAFLYQKFSQEADHEHANPWPPRPSTSCAAATNNQPRTASDRSWATTTGPARCTPKPNAPNATCFPTWSPR
jgi:ATP-dependent exoDNAse (exonuclease V) alpha subunit